jgi:predicted nuclease of predicted toxin-antitoxin system
VREAAEVEPEPGDHELLRWAAVEERILVTIDTDFGFLVFKGGETHAGIVRLPDAPVSERIALMKEVLSRYQTDLTARAILTVGRERVRVSSVPRFVE